MRRILGLIALAGMASMAAAPALAATCNLDVRNVVKTSPYLTGFMKQADGASSVAVEMTHVDDARIALIVTVRDVPPVPAGTSRAAYVDRIEAEANAAADVARNAKRQGDGSVYPYDPVAWRALTEEEVPGVGLALKGHMETLVTDGCLLVADFVSPKSVNLTARWSGVVDAVAGLRNAGFSVPLAWTKDDTTPTGWGSVLVGVGVPAAAVLALFLIIGRMLRLTPPGPATRIVSACGTAVAFGTALLLSPAYLSGLSEIRHTDGALVLLLVGAAALAGAAVGRSAALLALFSLAVGGAWTAAASVLGWTPDATVTGCAAGAMALLGVSGFYAWSQEAATAKIRRLTAERRAVA